jgi:hypothetical protein
MMHFGICYDNNAPFSFDNPEWLKCNGAQEADE